MVKWQKERHRAILLVGVIYKCRENNHRVHATDPRLLEKLDSFDLPFSLLHRYGLTHEMVNSVISLAREGLSIAAIARHIHNLREEFSAGLIKDIVLCYKHYLNSQTMKLPHSHCLTVLTLSLNHIQPMI